MWENMEIQHVFSKSNGCITFHEIALYHSLSIFNC